jgi:hypothetical protein
MMPLSPSIVTTLHPTAQLAIEQWWAQAKRNAFRTWSQLLINSRTGIFLITKAIKSTCVAQCLKAGHRGQETHILIDGLGTNATTWTLLRNDMGFAVLQDREYTVLIERVSSRMFRLLTDALKTAAQNLWAYPLLPPPTVPSSTFLGSVD